MSEHPLHDLAMGVRMDLTAAQGKLTEMMRQIGELEPPGPVRESFMNGPVSAASCPDCGVGNNLHTSDCQVLAGGEDGGLDTSRRDWRDRDPDRLRHSSTTTNAERSSPASGSSRVAEREEMSA